MSKRSFCCVNTSCLVLLRLLILVAVYGFFVTFIFFEGKQTRIEEAILFNQRVEVNLNSLKTYNKYSTMEVKQNTSKDLPFEEYIKKQDKSDDVTVKLVGVEKNTVDALQNQNKIDSINLGEVSDKPTIFFIVTGLGLNKLITESAINLPDYITLGFSAYGDINTYGMENSKLNGHDYIVNIPMQTADNNNDVPGPYTLSTKLSLVENIEKLNNITNKSDRYLAAYSSYDEIFTNDLFYTKTFVSALKQQNKYFIYANKNINTAVLQMADDIQYPIIVPDIYLNDAVSDADVNLKFKQIETIATNKGFAVVMLHSYPNILQSLIQWLSDNQDKNFNVAPVSLILGKKIISGKEELIN